MLRSMQKGVCIDMEEWREIRLKFWNQFYKYTQESDEATEFKNVFKNRKLQPSIEDSTAYYYRLNSGNKFCSLYCEMLVKPLGKANVRLDLVDNEGYDLNKVANIFYEHKIELESLLGPAVFWCKTTGKNRKIVYSTICDLGDERKWIDQFQWYCSVALLLRHFMDKYIGGGNGL